MHSRKFVASGKRATFIVGISRRVTSYEGLKLLLEIAGEGSVAVFHNANSSAGIFHPKLYLFEGEKKAAVVIASNNLTESGLFVNYELAIIIELDPQKREDQQLQTEVNQYIAELTVNSDVAKTLTPEFLEKLKESGALEVEAQETDSEAEEEEKAEAKLERAARQTKIKGLFGSAPVTSAPPTGKVKKTPAVAKPKAGEAVAAAQAAGTTLIMRPYPQRNKTQIQVPVIAKKMFFTDNNVISQHDNVSHGIRVAHARGKTNTLKLLPVPTILHC